jgi:hypothetical protein
MEVINSEIVVRLGRAYDTKARVWLTKQKEDYSHEFFRAASNFVALCGFGRGLRRAGRVLAKKEGVE